MKKTYRDPALLADARDRPCLLRVPHVCSNDPATTVACHSNQLSHGKGMGIKAHDFMTVWGCAMCHQWLDRSAASSVEKDAAFAVAYGRQIDWWRFLAAAQRNAPAKRAVQAFEEWEIEN
jgi:hypothetical protein